MTTQALPDLDQLANTYDVVGELAGRDDARMYLARRREDGLDVLIVLAGTMDGDEGNAQSHLAADANLLSSIHHRSVLPVIEGRWVGGDAFALVFKRTSAPTLAELLNRRDEEFDYARIAAILRETNGVLEWARAQKVVHRVVRPETLYVEPGTDRVQVAFAVTPLPASGVPGAECDGTTIAALARAMLTRSPAAPEREEQPLAELRPGLPTVLLEETEQLLHPQPNAEPRDVSGYVARIAMADALKEAQDHLEASRNLIERQEAEHRAQLEKERREHETQIAAERKAHEEQVAAERRQHEKEMETARKEHERLVAEQARQLQREREQHEKEFAEQQREFEKRVADQQRQFEKQVADQQRTFEKQVADQQRTFEKQVADEQKRFARQTSDQQKELQRERDEHAKQVALQAKQLQKEREEHERRMAEQTRKLEKERLAFDRELTKHREALEKERQALALERAAHARDRAALLEERSAHEQITREERDRLATEAAALASQADLYAHTTELPVPTSDMEVRFPRHLEREVEPPAIATDESDDGTAPPETGSAPSDDSTVEASDAAEETDQIDDVDEAEAEDEEEPTTRLLVSSLPFAAASSETDVVGAPQDVPDRVPALDFSQSRAGKQTVGESTQLSDSPHASSHDRVAAPATGGLAGMWARRPAWRSSWNVPAAAIALLLLIGVTVLALSGGSHSRRPASAQVSPVRVVDSAGGNVYESVVPLPRVETDTGVLSARATDWTPPPRRRTTPAPARPARTEMVPAQTRRADDDPAADFLGVVRPPADSSTPSLPVPTTPNRPLRRDSTPPRDTVRTPVTPLPFNIPAPARRDSTPKPDTTAKKDTTARK
jgi:hypothetical protein